MTGCTGCMAGRSIGDLAGVAIVTGQATSWSRNLMHMILMRGGMAGLASCRSLSRNSRDDIKTCATMASRTGNMTSRGIRNFGRMTGITVKSVEGHRSDWMVRCRNMLTTQGRVAGRAGSRCVLG